MTGAPHPSELEFGRIGVNRYGVNNYWVSGPLYDVTSEAKAPQAPIDSEQLDGIGLIVI